MSRSRAAVTLLFAGCILAVVRPVAADDPGHLKIVAIAPGYAGAAPSGERWRIYLDGFIDSGASDRFAALLGRESIADADVYFNSPGGHLVTAMALGRVVRERGYRTNVGARATEAGEPKAGVCYSACPFAYAGGVRRSIEASSVFGVHRATNSVPVASEAAFQAVVSDQAGEYLAAMGVSGELLAVMSAAPHGAIRLLTSEEAFRLGLVTVEPR